MQVFTYVTYCRYDEDDVNARGRPVAWMIHRFAVDCVAAVIVVPISTLSSWIVSII